MIRIIDNKKINITDDEWISYQQICRSYDRESFKGEELFRDLFETNDDGIIVFLRPPSNRHISFEVFMFLMIIFQQQYQRIANQKFDDLCGILSKKIIELDEKIKA